MAIHPSGFYLLIAHLDRIKVYAIHPDDVVPSPFSHEDIAVRGCTEIQFSNGGHLFAINDDDGAVSIYKFWQHERVEHGVFAGEHTDGSVVRAI